MSHPVWSEISSLTIKAKRRDSNIVVYVHHQAIYYQNYLSFLYYFPWLYLFQLNVQILPVLLLAKIPTIWSLDFDALSVYVPVFLLILLPSRSQIYWPFTLSLSDKAQCMPMVTLASVFPSSPSWDCHYVLWLWPLRLKEAHKISFYFALCDVASTPNSAN